MPIRLDTPLIEFHKQGVGKLSAQLSRKLALAVAANFGKSDAANATVEDLLNYQRTIIKDILYINSDVSITHFNNYSGSKILI